MPRNQRTPSLTLVVFIWLAPQLLSLTLSAMRVPLSAHPPRPIESVALQQMVIVQIVTAAMFAPVIFRSATCVLAIVLTAFPMLQLAAFLSSATLTKVTTLSPLEAGWATVLGALCVTISDRKKPVVSAVATAWSLGGLVLAYLHTEFAPQRSLPPAVFGPAYAVVLQNLHDSMLPTSWFFLGTFTTLGVAITCAAWLRQRHATAID